MIRYLVLGFVDHDAVREHKLALRNPLDRPVVQRLVAELGEVSRSGEISVDGHALLWHDGFLTCPAPVIRPKAVDFIVRLARETACDIADVELGQILTPEAFRAHCQLMADLIAQTPAPFGNY
jgi:hypothetical protein